MGDQTMTMLQKVYDRFEAGVNVIWDKCVVPGAVAIYDNVLANFMRYDEAEEKRFHKLIFWGLVFDQI